VTHKARSSAVAVSNERGAHNTTRNNQVNDATKTCRYGRAGLSD